MKKQTTILFSQLGQVHVRTLTTIVKEALAVDYKSAEPRVFTAAELWSIQRQKKAVGQRRFHF